MINLSLAETQPATLTPRIAVMGVGGAGSNAVNNMIRAQLEGCDFIVANTDSQALQLSLAPRKLQLGVSRTRGLGAGSKPEIGRAAAEEQIDDIMACLEGSDMVFVTAGMGGGTGTGAAPVIARAAREHGILTVGVVTKPFHFEGTRRMAVADAGLAELQQYVDTLIVIPNQNLFRLANERTTFAEAFRMADEVLHCGVRGITDLMVMPGFMNLDFADVKTVMAEMGKAMMGTGEADGDDRALRAAEAAISNPLLDDVSLQGAKGVLINITGGMDMTLFEVDQAANRIRDEVDKDAQIKVGSTLSEELNGKIRVSVIATGIDAQSIEISQRQGQQKAAAAAAPATENRRPPLVRARDAGAPRQNISTVLAASATAAKEARSVDLTSSQIAVKQPEKFSADHTTQAQQAQKKNMVAKTAKEEAQLSLGVDDAVSTHTTAEAEAPAQAADQAPIAADTTSSPPASPSPTVAEPVSDIDPTKVEAATIKMTQIQAGISRDTQKPADRARALFSRITGFGLVRPSTSKKDDDGMDDELDDVPPHVADQKVADQKTAEQKQGVKATTTQDDDDLLDIPAFLRRSGH